MASYPNPQNLIIARTSPSSAPVSVSVYARFRTEDPDFSLTQPTAALPFFNTFSLTEEEEEVIQKMRETTTPTFYMKRREVKLRHKPPLVVSVESLMQLERQQNCLATSLWWVG